jgi:hypothetical protein
LLVDGDVLDVPGPGGVLRVAARALGGAGGVDLGGEDDHAQGLGAAVSAQPLPADEARLLLRPPGDVLAQVPGDLPGARYLKVLVPPEEGQAPVPAGAYNVAAQLLAAEAGADGHPPAARVHLAAGRWLTLHAARIGADDIENRDIAVSIEPAAPGDRVSVFARACGLSRRSLLARALGA